MPTKITEVQISFIKPLDGLIGFASLVINGQLYLSSIGIHKKLSQNGYRLTYPTKKIGSTSIDLYHPICKEVTTAIEKAVFEKLKDVMSKRNDRHNSSESGF